MHLFQSYARSKSSHKIAFDFLKFSEANEQQRIKHSQRCGRDLVDTRYADIISSRSGLYPRDAVHRLASPQTSFGVRSSSIHFYPTDSFSYERVAQFNLEWIFIKLDSGFQSLVGFRILSAGFRIPKPRIPDSTSKKNPGFRNPARASFEQKIIEWIDHIIKRFSLREFYIIPGLFRRKNPLLCDM